MIGRCIGRKKGVQEVIKERDDAMKIDAVTRLVLVQISWGLRTPIDFFVCLDLGRNVLCLFSICCCAVWLWSQRSHGR